MTGHLTYSDRMRDSDALMWIVERDPLLRSTMLGILVLDRAPDRDALAKRMEHASQAVPRLRQRPVVRASVRTPWWEVDPHFDLDYHLRWVSASGSRDVRYVLDLAQPITMQNFDPQRPLWEMTVIDGLADGRAAVILKLHHAVTDAVGFVRMAAHIFDVDATGTTVASMMPPQEAPDGKRLRRSSGAWARGLLSAPRRSWAMVRSTLRLWLPSRGPLSPAFARRRSLGIHLDTMSIPIDALKVAGKSGDGRLNDAFVAAVLGGLQRYHDHLGASTARLRMTMAVNVRTTASEGVAGNQFTPARLVVPLDIKDPVERIRTVRDLSAPLQSEPALDVINRLAPISRRLPKALSTAMVRGVIQDVDFVTSNVPGPPIPLYLAGARIQRQFAFGPLMGAAVNVALFSYNGEANIGLRVDPAAVPDPDLLGDCLRAALDEITATDPPRTAVQGGSR